MCQWCQTRHLNQEKQMFPSFTTVISAGSIKKDDGKMFIIQNFTVEQAKSLAEVLAIATDGPAHVMRAGMEGLKEYYITPADVPYIDV